MSDLYSLHVYQQLDEEIQHKHTTNPITKNPKSRTLTDLPLQTQKVERIEPPRYRNQTMWKIDLRQ